jgi:hypothetical protein
MTLEEAAQAFIEVLAEITAAGFSPPPSAGHGKKSDGWVVIEYPWGTTKGYAPSLAYHMRKELYAVLGERMVADSMGIPMPWSLYSHPKVQTAIIISWCLKLSTIVDKLRLTSL